MLRFAAHKYIRKLRAVVHSGLAALFLFKHIANKPCYSPGCRSPPPFFDFLKQKQKFKNKERKIETILYKNKRRTNSSNGKNL